MTNIPKWVAAAFSVALLATLANSAMLVRQIVAPAPTHPVYAAKDLQKDHEFKKAVESIAQSQGYVDESDVASIIEGCKAIVGGRLKCN
jgi:hypothetical protein